MFKKQLISSISQCISIKAGVRSMFVLSDSFRKNQVLTQHMLGISKEDLKQRLEELLKTTNTQVPLEDFKKYIYSCENNARELNLVLPLAKRYVEQVNLNQFHIGPEILRLYWSYNLPQLALEVFETPALSPLFKHLTSHIIICTLQFESGKYNKVMQLCETTTSSNLFVPKYPASLSTLYLASAYKLNNADSLSHSLKWCEAVSDEGRKNNKYYVLGERQISFVAALALNVNDPGVCLKVLAHNSKRSAISASNLRMQALALTGSVQESILCLQQTLDETRYSVHDQPKIFRETLDVINSNICESDSSAKATFDRLQKGLQQAMLIFNQSLDSYLLRPLQIKRSKPRDSTLGLDSKRSSWTKSFDRRTVVHMGFYNRRYLHTGRRDIAIITPLYTH